MNPEARRITTALTAASLDALALVSECDPKNAGEQAAAWRARHFAEMEGVVIAYGKLIVRLALLRDEIATRLADENRDRQMIAEHALDVLTDLLEGGSDGTDL